jgi:two-component system chemotaxis response regulator CheB
MPTHDIVCIGASAGGVEALQRLVKLLPADLPAAIFIVLHIPENSPSLLPLILERTGNLPAVAPANNTPIKHGRIYVAPPDHHMLLEPGRVHIIRGPKENRHRPAIDPLFRSAGSAYRSRVVGVVLSGNLDDGTAGLSAIKACGGTTIVQDPAEALFPDMPGNALKNSTVDHRLVIKEIAKLLTDLANRTAAEASEHIPKGIQTEVEFSKMKKEPEDMSDLGGTPTAFACPSCHGALWELRDGNLARYRCHTGHAFSPESLLAEQSDAVEEALYSALRALQEKATALRRLASHYTNVPELQRDYELRAGDADKSADSIRILLNGGKEP